MDVISHHSSAGSSGGNSNNNSNSSTSTKKVAKFLPKNIAAKTRWRKQSKESFGSAASSEEDPRGREPTRDTGLDDSIGSLPVTISSSNYDLDHTDEAHPRDPEFDQDAPAGEGASDHDS